MGVGSGKEGMKLQKVKLLHAPLVMKLILRQKEKDKLLPEIQYVASFSPFETQREIIKLKKKH